MNFVSGSFITYIIFLKSKVLGPKETDFLQHLKIRGLTHLINHLANSGFDKDIPTLVKVVIYLILAYILCFNSIPYHSISIRELNTN